MNTFLTLAITTGLLVGTTSAFAEMVEKNDPSRPVQASQTTGQDDQSATMNSVSGFTGLRAYAAPGDSAIAPSSWQNGRNGAGLTHDPARVDRPDLR